MNMIDLTAVLEHSKSIESVERRRQYLQNALKKYRNEQLNDEESYMLFFESIRRADIATEEMTEEDREAFFNRPNDSSNNEGIAQKISDVIDGLQVLIDGGALAVVAANTKPITLEAFTDQYCQMMLDRGIHRPKTNTVSRQTLGILQRHIGNVQLSSIQAIDVDNFLAERGRSVKKYTLLQNITALRAAFEHAKAWDYVTVNHFASAKKPRPVQKGIRYFSGEAFDKFLSVVKHKGHRYFFIFAKETGLRKGELINLEWSDVTEDGLQIHVHSKHDFQTKNGLSRYVPLTEQAREALDYMWSIRKGSYIFYGRNGQRRVDKGMSTQFKNYVYQVPEIDQDLHLHSLRHTYVTMSLAAGVNVNVLFKLTGHSSPTEILNTYGHQYREGINEIATLQSNFHKQEAAKRKRNQSRRSH